MIFMNKKNQTNGLVAKTIGSCRPAIRLTRQAPTRIEKYGKIKNIFPGNPEQKGHCKYSAPENPHMKIFIKTDLYPARA